MSMWKKIMTAFRGSVHEAGEAIVDKNAIRILEQEIRDAEKSLGDAKRNLTSVMAKEMDMARSVKDLDTQIKKYEDYAVKALDKGDENLALEVAEKIATLSEDRATKAQMQQNFANHIAKMKDMIKKSNTSLASMKQKMLMIKTTDSVQKTTMAISENYNSTNSTMFSAKESLERIQKRQQETDDKLAASDILAADFNDQSLEDKLEQADIKASSSKAADILAELRAKK